MLSLPPSVRIFLCTVPIDGRLGIDGLAGLVLRHFDTDPYSGHLFVFRTRRGDRLKILFWDRDGYILYYKRLERGKFSLPRAAVNSTSGALEIRASELTMLLDGIDLDSAQRRPRYQRPTSNAS